MSANLEIRLAVRKSKIYMYMLSDAMNIHENTLYRMLRKPLPENKKQEILNIIQHLSTSKSN